MFRSTQCRAGALGVFVSLSMLAGWSAAAQDAKAPDYDAIIAAPDRSEADRQTDKRRDPTELLAFTGAKPAVRISRPTSSPARSSSVT